ncbi:MAG: cobalamin-dependent protein [Anaerolineales bacterium]|nr:cobalamin-dependent protein [Anaerolineales bacterium]
MSKAQILEKLTEAIVDIDDELVMELVDEGLEAGLGPLEIITEGLQPGLTIIGEGFDKHTRFTSDLVLAGEILNDAMEKMRPIMEAGGGGTGDVMVIGTVEGDVHNVGKRVVSSVFTGAGYMVIDIGENQAASAFVKAAKEHNAKIVGASAILGPQKPYCKVIHDALVEAGIRDNLLYIIGGWGMTQEWCERVHADAYGDTANEALAKVNKILQARV